jgi:uncharacterized protein YciI
MVQLLAVVRSRGERWNQARPLEEQDEWPSHAVFMNVLAADGFVVLGGPLEGTPDTLLIIRADNAQQVAARLADDPWTRNGLLEITRVLPWTLRLGSLG